MTIQVKDLVLLFHINGHSYGFTEIAEECLEKLKRWKKRPAYDHSY